MWRLSEVSRAYLRHVVLEQYNVLVLDLPVAAQDSADICTQLLLATVRARKSSEIATA
jgi:hypothetical protein